MLRAAVAGATGYAGGEILRLLLTHPEVEIGALTAASSAGSRLADHHEHLHALADRHLEPTSPEAFTGHDVVFLALPHGHSAAIANALPQSVTVIDCGADHRLEREADWRAYYDTPYAGSWAYGLPELPWRGSKRRAQLTGATRIAVPGCYPTGVSLALAPLFAAGLAEHDDVVVVAASGTSGAGKSLAPRLLGAQVMGSMSPYGVGGVHRHTPEIAQNLRGAADAEGEVSISFTPTLAPMPRGILATCTARPRAGVSAADIDDAFGRAYSNERFVRLLPEGCWPSTGSVLGSNLVTLRWIFDEGAGRVIVVAALDNLTKGTAGAAVQSMNLSFGFPEELGLPTVGVAP